MPLGLILGPASSGKTGAILDRFQDGLAREPVLVLPTAADVERFEDELLDREDVPLGGRLVTFAGLVDEVAAATGVAARPRLGDVQRRALVAAVARETRLAALAAAAERPGFVAALDAFLAELRAARVAPAELAERARGLAAARGADGGHLRELAALHAAYDERLRALGRDDGHGLAAAATAALAERPGAWGARPVLVYGFDDLTREQLALVEALARAADVTVAVVHERERACLAARERVLHALLSAGARIEDEREPHAPGHLLAHLERSLLVEDAAPRPADGRLVLLEAAGARAEVELAGAEVARLIRAGVAPGRIAVIARSPDAHAPLVEEVFAAYGIPLAADARVPLARTGVGRGLDALLHAALTGRTAADVVAYLRAPGRASPGQVDRLERSVRVERLTSAEDAEAAWSAGGGRELWELAALREAAAAGPGPLAARLADLARDLAEAPLRRTAPILDVRDRLERLAAEEAARALRELADLAAVDPAAVPDAAAIAGALATLEVRRWRGARARRVELLGPYAARARQFDHVFVLGLNEGEFPRRAREDPFLADDERAPLGLPDRADPRDEERYLLYVCVSRARERLHLSHRTTDEAGGELPRSFLLDDLLELVSGDVPVRARGLSDTVFAPADAPTEDELARALAAWRLDAPPPALGADAALAERLSARLRRARRRAEARPGPLRVPRVLAELARRDAFGASSLEQYAECPFRYFVQHELRPRELAPQADELARGTLIHDVLERLYAERGAPTRATADACAERARELVAERAADSPLAPVTPAARAELRRVESDVVRFVRWDAERPFALDLVAVEAGFGQEGDERGPLELGDGVRLHGKVDRIDRTPAGEAFVRDYKSGRSVASAAEMRERKRLQLPLYLLAVEELWGMPAAGGVYHPLGDQAAQEPRGLVRGPLAPPLDAAPLKQPDVTGSEEEFRERLEEARAEAVALAGRIRAGHLARDPIGGSCPAYCHLHAICRRERGEKNPPENGARRPPADD